MPYVNSPHPVTQASEEAASRERIAIERERLDLEKARLDEVSRRERRASDVAEGRMLLALLASDEAALLAGGDEEKRVCIEAEIRKRATALIMGNAP